MKLISVIVPVYKVEDYLNRCVRSIVEQTYSNLEIILVDDGSSDNCPRMCEEWAQKDSRIQVIHKQNGGLSDARNTGLKVAKGTWVAFVDSDDWIASDFFEVLIKAGEDNNAKIVASGVVTIDEEQQDFIGRKYEQKIFSAKEALYTIMQGDGFHAVAWNKIYRRELFEGIEYPIGKLHEDEYVTYCLIDRADTLVLCQETFYYYWQRQGSIMSSWSPRHLDALEAWTGRLQLLQVKYPELYPEDYVGFCIACVNYYQKVLSVHENKKYLQIIKNYRNSIKLTIKQWRILNNKQKTYVAFSKLGIGMFAKVLNFRRKGNE